MKFNDLVSRVLRPLRTLMIVFAAVVMVFSSMVPAMAISSDRSHPTEGEAPLNDIYGKAEEALKSGQQDLKEVQSKANRGINEVQADADVDKMNRTDNSSQATTAKEQAERALKKLTGDR